MIWAMRKWATTGLPGGWDEYSTSCTTGLQVEQGVLDINIARIRGAFVVQTALVT